MTKSIISTENFDVDENEELPTREQLTETEILATYPMEQNAPAARGEEPKYYIGIDLHSNNIVYCVLTQEDGHPKKVKTGKVSCVNTEGICAVFEALRPFCENTAHFAVVEATYNWYWLANLFEAEGWFLRLADPCTVSQANLKHANDHTDAAYLAERLRVHALKTFPIMGRKARDIRDLSRYLMTLKQDLARLKIIVINQLTNHCSTRVRIQDLIREPLEIVESAQTAEDYGDKLNAAIDKSIAGLISTPGTRRLLRSELRRIVLMTQEVDQLSQELFAITTKQTNARVLQTIKGCGEVLSTIIATEVGDIQRFRTAKEFQSYCRLAPTSKLSNGKSKGLGNAKNGNAYLSWSLTELATLMARYNPEVKTEFQRLLARSGNLRVKAIRTLAAKISRAIFYMLRNGEVFDVNRCFAIRRKKAAA